jgi:hypothetical protein
MPMSTRGLRRLAFWLQSLASEDLALCHICACSSSSSSFWLSPGDSNTASACLPVRTACGGRPRIYLSSSDCLPLCISPLASFVTDRLTSKDEIYRVGWLLLLDGATFTAFYSPPWLGWDCQSSFCFFSRGTCWGPTRSILLVSGMGFFLQPMQHREHVYIRSLQFRVWSRMLPEAWATYFISPIVMEDNTLPWRPLKELKLFQNNVEQTKSKCFFRDNSPFIFINAEP